MRAITFRVAAPLLLALTALSGSQPALAQAQAQAFPSKPITVVVAYPAGGPADQVIRVLQPHLQRLLGQTLIVENVGGAGGSLGVQKVINATPDGHTVLAGSPMELVQTPLAMAAAKYKPEDIRPLAMLVATNMVLLARKDLPAETVDDLVALARRPGAKELSYGSVGAGSMYHLVAEKFSEQTGVKMLHVPYKGGAPLATDLMGGQIDVAFMPLAGGVPGMIQSGKVKALGLAAPQRYSGFPNLPTIGESKAVQGDFSFDLWMGLQATRNVSDEVAAKLNAAVVEALRVPEVRKELEATGNRVAAPMNLQEVSKVYTADALRYRAIAKSIKLEAQ